MSQSSTPPAGWYHAQGDPPDTQRYWDGYVWQGEPVPVPPSHVAPGEPGSYQPTPNPAGAGSRIGGRVIDSILIGLVNLAISFVFLDITSFFTTGDPDVAYSRVLAAVLITGAISLSYETLMVAFWGATLGKMAVGNKVVMAVDGSQPTLGAAAIRFAIYGGLAIVGGLMTSAALSALFQGVDSLLSLAGLIMLFAHSRRQTPWDLVAKTLVVPR